MPSRIFPLSKHSSSLVELAHESLPPIVAKSHRQLSNVHSRLFGFKLGFGVGASLSILFFMVFLLLRLLKCRKSRQRQNRAPTKYSQSSIKLKHFAYKELKVATQGFNGELKLGQGGFGAVYKGTLKDGREVAVKKLNTASLQGEREFQNELSVIGHVCASPHIVPLVGFCSNGKQRLLVYEYMHNHSLQEALFDEEYPIQLHWEKRLSIIVDTCKALVFLHGCEPPIIHGDIKPSNVLLDAMLCAKVADFGLARFKTTCITSTEQSDVAHKAMCAEVHKFGHRRGAEKQRKSVRKEASIVSVTSIARVKEQHEHDESVNCESNGRQSTSTVFTTSPDSDASSFLVGKLVCESSQTSVDGNGVLHDSLLSDSDIGTSSSPLPEAEDELLELDSKYRMVRVNAEHVAHEFMQENGVFDGEAESKGAPFGLEQMGGNCRHEIEFVAETWKEKRKSAFGRDWWWRQESSGELSVKDYVMDWMGHENRGNTPSKEGVLADHADGENDACPESSRKSSGRASRERRDYLRNLEPWSSCPQEERDVQHVAHDVVLQVDKKKGRTERESDGWTSAKENRCITSNACTKTNDVRLKDSTRTTWRSASLEWWRDENTEEGSGNSKSKKASCKERPKSREWWKDEDLANNKEWKAMKKKREQSLSGEWSGELSSRRVGSTPSMRGTLCYVAPENGGNGVMSEKSDVYSFGVLLLVIISGRRPLQVMASPMTEFERANLISWARQLAHSGNVLDLVDPSLHGNFCRKQATLSITVALLCLQRLPSKRPSMIDIFKMLLGELEAPSLPFQFSPSPPCRVPYRSRRCSSSSERVAIDFTFSN